jgi:zinc protease
MMKLSVLAAGAAAFALAACSGNSGSKLASCGESAAAPAAPGGALSIEPLKWACRKLPNGLRVYAMPSTDTASVSVAVWYNVGSKDDPPGRSGFAHLFEHMMFKSTANMPSETFDRLTEDVGGFNNASTNNDYTDYYETVPANHLERVLWAESERMGSLVVDDAVFKSERDVVKEEFRQSVLSRPFNKLFYLYLSQAGFTVHPYGRPGIGSIEELDAATVDDVRAFHAAYYRPDNAVMVVSGNFDEKQLEGYVSKYFAPIATPKRPIPRVTAVEPVRTGPKEFTVYEPNTPLPLVAIAWPAPAATDKDMPVIEVMDAIMTAGQSSRFYQSLVYDQQLAADANSFLDTTAQPGQYAVYAILSQGRSADEGLVALNAEIARMRDNPVSDAELEEARNELITSALRSRETSDGRAAELAQAVVIDGNPNAADEQLARLQTVTAADIQRVARALMDDGRAYTFRYLPEEAQNGAAEATFADSPTIEATRIDIPAAEIPSFTLNPEASRVQPPAEAAAIAAKVPGATEKTLPNGLRVIVANKPGLPLVSASLRIGAGGSIDPGDKAGLATMTADIATRGTRTRSATEIARQIESLGASLDASASVDATAVSISSRSDKAGDVFTIMSDVVQNQAFAQEELDRAKQETLDGLMVSLRQPSTVGGYAMTRALFGAGPYGGTPTPKSITALKQADLSAFHSTWWRPDNSILVITGDVTPDQGFAMAEKALGGWPRPATAAPELKTSESAAPAPRAIVIDIPKAGQAAVLLGGIGPSRTAENYFPTLLAANVVGGGYSARLNAEIRIKRGLSYGTYANFGGRKASAPVTASGQTRNDAVPDVIDLMTAEFARLGSEPVPAAELDARKAVIIGGFGRSVETTGGLAGQLSALAQFGLPLDKLQSYSSDVAAVTSEQVQAAAKAYFDPAKSVLIAVGDAQLFWDKIKDKREGFEAGLSRRVGALAVGANYTWLDATYQSLETVNGASNSTNSTAAAGARGLDGNIVVRPGDRIPLIPQHLFKAYADYRATEALSLGVNFIAVGSSYARGNENNLHQPDGVYYLGPGKAGGYGVVNLNAEYRFEPRFTVFGQINNLFDREYYTASLLGPTGFTANGNFIARPLPAAAGQFPIQQATFYAPGAPRTFWVGLRYQFDPKPKVN